MLSSSVNQALQREGPSNLSIQDTTSSIISSKKSWSKVIKRIQRLACVKHYHLWISFKSARNCTIDQNERRYKETVTFTSEVTELMLVPSESPFLRYMLSEGVHRLGRQRP